jgi:hypothetical protein
MCSEIGLPKTKPVRFTKVDYKKYQNIIMEIGKCQLCGSYDISTPHHSLFGIHKDDRSLMCICNSCHIKIHDKGDKELEERAVSYGDLNWSNAPKWLKDKYE